jgi:hypothetical protein
MPVVATASHRIFDRRVLLFLIVLCASSPARAFLYNEHRDVSNEAMRRAFAYARSCCGSSESMARRLEAIRDFVERRPSDPAGVTYGDLVAIVDYVTEPFALLNRRGIRDGSETDICQLLSMNVAKNRGFFRMLHASHGDVNHFQDGGLVSFAYWHKTAILLAGDREKGDVGLFLALIFNSYADHPLQDFFAPGHTLTPRRDLHDASAMALHDFFHRGPHVFEIDVATLDALKDFFEDKAIFARLRAAGVVNLYGDGSLWRNPEQAEFVAAVQARSIADVLLAGIGEPVEGKPGEPSRSSFEPFDWRPYKRIGASTRTPLAKLPFGQYRQEKRSNLNALGWAPVLNAHAGFQSLFGSSQSSSRGLFDFETIVLGSPGRSWREGRVGIENITQFGLGFNYAYISSRAYRGNSAGARIYFPETAFDLQASLGVNHRWYSSATDSARRWAYDAKLEFGYGIAFAGLGVGRDYQFVAGRGFQPAWAFSASIGVGFPPSAFGKIFGKDRGVPQFAERR